MQQSFSLIFLILCGLLFEGYTLAEIAGEKAGIFKVCVNTLNLVQFKEECLIKMIHFWVFHVVAMPTFSI